MFFPIALDSNYLFVQDVSKKPPKSSNSITTCKINTRPEAVSKNNEIKTLEGRVSEEIDESCLKISHLIGISHGSLTAQSSIKKASRKLSKDEKKLLADLLYLYPQNYGDNKSSALSRVTLYADTDLQYQLFKALFKLGVSPYSLDSMGRPIYEKLIECSKKDVNLKALQLFFDNGLYVKHLPLINLVYNDLFDLFKEAIDKGANLDQKCFSKTPQSSFFSALDLQECIEVPLLHSLAFNKNHPSKFFEYMKNADDIDINAVNEKGQTLLMCLLNNPNAYREELTWLLSRKPNMDMLDHKGRSALFYLLMSVNQKDFRSYFNLLCDNGFNFQKAMLDNFTHFEHCLRLLGDLSITHKDLAACDFEKNDQLLQTIHYIIPMMNYTFLPLYTYLTLPKFLQEALQKGSRIKSFKIGRHVKMKPSEYDQYFHTWNPSNTEKLDTFWLRICSVTAGMKTTLDPNTSEGLLLKPLIAKAFRKSQLSILFASTNSDGGYLNGIFFHLIRALRREVLPLQMLIEKKAYLNEELFVEALSNDLMIWKDAQIKKAISQRREWLIDQEKIAYEKAREEQQLEQLFHYDITDKANRLRTKRIDSLAYTELLEVTTSKASF